MNKNSISIIIPIYNAEKYLEELLQSIKKQSYKNYEVLLINDGSSDKSEKICKDFIKKEKGIHTTYYSKENTGVSDTRNFGLEKANNEYICFVDADDVLNENYLLDFVATMGVEQNSLVCCDYSEFDEITKINNDVSDIKINTKYANKSKYEVLFSRQGGYLWNKLFKKEIINNNKIKFDSSISMMEDMLFVFEYLECIDNVVLINKKNYNYRISCNSASKKISNANWFSNLKVLDVINLNQEKLSKKALSSFSYTYLFYLYEGIYRLPHIEKSKRKAIKAMINQKLKETNKLYRNIPSKQRIKIYIYKYLNKIAFSLKLKRH